MKNSYLQFKSFKETYTGGEISWEERSGCILCPTETKLNLINKSTGLLTATLQESDEKILASCSSNGKIAVAYESEQVIIYSLNLDSQWEVSGKVKCRQVQHMDFSSDGKLLAIASSDTNLKVFSVAGGYCTHNFMGHRGIVSRCWFLPFSSTYTLFSIDQECDIRKWDLVKKECVGTLSHHDSGVTCLAMIDANTIVSSGRDKVLNVWDITTNKLLKSIAMFEEIESIIPLERGNGKESFIITAGRNGILKIWDIGLSIEKLSFNPFQKRTLSEDTEAQAEESYLDYIISLGNNEIAVANRGQMIAIVDISSQPFKNIKTIVGWNDSILDLAFIKYPKDLGGDCSNVVVASNAPSLRILNINTNSWTVLHGAHEGNILKLSISHDKEWLATSSSDGIVKIWKLIFGETLGLELAGHATGHLEGCSALHWATKSTSFLISASADTTLKMWDTSKLSKWKVGSPPLVIESLIALKAHEKEVNCVKVSPNELLLATVSQDKTIKLWKLNKKAPFISDPVILSGHKRGIWNCAFSPVDKILATCSTDSTIKIWSLENSTCMRTLQGHSGSVLTVEFVAPLGSQLLSGGADGVLKLWNVKEGECVNSFTNHSDKIWTIVAVPDTSTGQLLTGGADSVITYWKDNTEAIEKKKRDEEQKLMEGTQQLTNLLKVGQYALAAKLAIQLNHTRKLYFIFENCFQNNKIEFNELIKSLNQEELVYTILRTRDWNTHSKTSIIAQEILYVIFSTYKPSSLAQLPLMKQALQGLIPYTERHITHLDTSIQESYIIDYTLNQMKQLV